jgi:hypothetical protein
MPDPFDTPHEGCLSSAPRGLGPRLCYLNDLLGKAYASADQVQQYLTGQRNEVAPDRKTAELPPPISSERGLEYLLELAITRATGLAGAIEGLHQPFREDPKEIDNRAQARR